MGGEFLLKQPKRTCPEKHNPADMCHGQSLWAAVLEPFQEVGDHPHQPQVCRSTVTMAFIRRWTKSTVSPPLSRVAGPAKLSSAQACLLGVTGRMVSHGRPGIRW